MPTPFPPWIKLEVIYILSSITKSLERDHKDLVVHERLNGHT